MKDSKKTCLIISGGDYCELPGLKSEADRDVSASAICCTTDAKVWGATDNAIADLIIACDRGYEHAVKMGIRPHLIVGDFDSAEKPDTDIPVVAFPSRKDYTDTMIAMMHAIDEGCNDIKICCALGGRLDHTYANIETLAFAAKKGAVASIVSDDTEITVFENTSIKIPKREGWSMSIFSRTDKSQGVSIKGAEYEVEDFEMTNCLTLGQSNLVTAEAATVSVRKGMLIVIQSKLKPGEHI